VKELSSYVVYAILKITQKMYFTEDDNGTFYDVSFNPSDDQNDYLLFMTRYI
jgi:hypothetical protein